jgi:hypothetical protein
MGRPLTLFVHGHSFAAAERTGARAHEFTREDRAKGGRARAEKVRRRKELRERFEVGTLEDLAAAEDELLERALIRHGLVLASDDPRASPGEPARSCTTGSSVGQDVHARTT